MAVSRGRAAGPRRLASVVAHLRGRTQLQHDSQARRHDLYPCGSPRSPALRRDHPEPSRDRTDNLLQRPARLRYAIPALKADRELRERFFSRLQIIFTAAAALPQNLWDELKELAVECHGRTGPDVFRVGLDRDCSAGHGLPFSGDTVRRHRPASAGDGAQRTRWAKLEIRVRGPNLTPGYWHRPDVTASHFDAEGFYRIGDAVRWVDPERPEQGLLFDGRISEDFKLDSGSWVNVGMLRVAAVAALAPVARGHRARGA